MTTRSSPPPSLWQRLAGIAQDLFADPAAKDPQTDAMFAAAVVALAAKMARADGRATLDEAAAFRAAFPLREADRPLFDRLFALAQETVAGFEGYARKLARRCRAHPGLLRDILDVLFAIAAVDGRLTEGEERYLQDVGRLFGITGPDFEHLAARHFPDREPDPYTLLGIDPGADDAAVRRAWLKAVADNHPDTWLARGAPEAFIAAANHRTATANTAYHAIRASRTSRARV
jgi:DnaJ like chaperone protein